MSKRTLLRQAPSNLAEAMAHFDDLAFLKSVAFHSYWGNKTEFLVPSIVWWRFIKKFYSWKCVHSLFLNLFRNCRDICCIQISFFGVLSHKNRFKFVGIQSTEDGLGSYKVWFILERTPKSDEYPLKRMPYEPTTELQKKTWLSQWFFALHTFTMGPWINPWPGTEHPIFLACR